MSKAPSEDIGDLALAQPEYLYTVLNLPATATKEEIRERYRQLSLVFHPDKQHGKPTQETALKRFLEVQKAYEILSDPVTRQAYDLYGLEGVKLARDSQLSGLSEDEIARRLAFKKAEADYQREQAVLRASGEVGVGVDARTLFVEVNDERFISQPLQARAWDRVRSVKFSGVSVKNTIQKSVSDAVTLTVAGYSRVGAVGGLGSPTGRHVIGTVRYQYSPKIGLDVSTSLLKARSLTLGGNFDDGDNAVVIKTFFAPNLVNGLANLPATANSPVARLPPISLTLQRRLFPNANMFGVFEISTQSSWPVVTLAVSSQQQVNLGIEPPSKAPRAGPPSRTGLAVCIGHWSTGLSLLGPLPTLFGECGLVAVELGLRLKGRIEASLTGQNGVLSASWNTERNVSLSKLGVDVGVGTAGVSLKVAITYMNQSFYMPIMLSSEYDATAALWTTVLPTAAVALAYHFVLRPRKRQERLAFFRQARRELREAKSDIVRAAEETAALLRDTARRHTDAEAARDGLVIVDARYGPAACDDAARGLDVDVTVPLQALVHNSQLYIPGGRSKAGLQGFYDPVPSAGKSLRVRYVFRGRPHYAEIADEVPLVLPLAEHRVR